MPAKSHERPGRPEQTEKRQEHPSLPKAGAGEAPGGAEEKRREEKAKTGNFPDPLRQVKV
jgi:hypothetical protein